MIKVQSLLIALLFSTSFCISQKSSIVVNLIPYGESGYYICRGIELQYRYQKDKYFGAIETGIITSNKHAFDDYHNVIDDNIYRFRVSDVHTSFTQYNNIDQLNAFNTKGEAIKLLKGGISSMSQEFISIHFGILKKIKESNWSWSVALGPRIGLYRSTLYDGYTLLHTDSFKPYHEIRQIHEKYIFLKANVQSGINYNLKDNLAIGARFSYARPLNNFFSFHLQDYFFSASLAVKI